MENGQTLKKQRHGCVTALLIFMMFVNSASILIYFFADDLLNYNVNFHFTNSDKIILRIFQVSKFISCILLFRWKKIGFWAYVATYVAIILIYIYQDKGLSQLWSALFGIALLFGVMQITAKNRKTIWEDLD